MAFPTPAPLRDLPRYPVTGGVIIAAVVVTGAWWMGRDVEPLFTDARAWYGEPWRLVTSALPHLDLIHLVFNLYWVWTFGSILEGTLGRWATAGLVLLFAAGSAAAEYALFSGGVGLSGVGYGLFGLLWVLSRRDFRFVGAVDDRVAFLFLGWFVLCCLTTWAGVWHVANAAHGAGAVLGALVGLTMAGRRRARLAAGAVLVVTLVLIVLGGTVGRRYVNFRGEAGRDMAYLGYRALEEKDDRSAVLWIQRALAQNPDQADWWHNLGVAWHRLDEPEKADEAFKRAHQARLEDQLKEAIRRHKEALPGNERQAEFWYRLGEACREEGRRGIAAEAYKRAEAIEPDNERYREAAKDADNRPEDPPAPGDKDP